MPTATALFRMPEDPTALMEVVEGLGGVFEDAPQDDDVRDWALGMAGQPTSVVLEDSEDPIDDMEAILVHLRKTGAPYIAVTDSFSEPTRGARALGRVYVNRTGEPADEYHAQMPWQSGEPKIDRHTLQEADHSREMAEEILDLMLARVPDPAP